MTPQETKSYLESFFNFELRLDQVDSSAFKLDRIQELLKRLENPQDRLNVIHVAGSKGKGSTCAFVATILKEQGYKVGLYTSPHIEDFRERIRILDISAGSTETKEIFPDMISSENLCVIVAQTKSEIESLRNTEQFGRLTFFEVYTALAFYYFAQQGVDFAVLETGLGGRLDATNVTKSIVCALTPISLEHTQILGDTLTEIACEKGAIIKSEKQKVVIAHQEPEVRKVLEDRCQQFCLRPRAVGFNLHYEFLSEDLDGQTFNFQGKTKTLNNLRSSLAGRHQLMNAATALGVVEALEELGYKIGDEAIREGLKNVQWPGRFEVIRRQPLIILDCAHTQNSVQALVNTMHDVLPDKKITLVLGLSKDKDKEGICSLFDPIVTDVIATKSKHPRASDISDQDLQHFFPTKQCQRTATVAEALTLADQNIGDDFVILVAGSIFVVGEARRFLMQSVGAIHESPLL